MIHPVDLSCEDGYQWEKQQTCGGFEGAGTFVFGALDCLFVSEPDKKGGDSPERVKGWGSLCFGDKCRTEVNSSSVARADP